VASYKILIKSSAAKEIESAPKKDRLRIIKRIQDLSSDPRPPGCEKLSGHDDKYRVRQGTYRIVYAISDVGLIVCMASMASLRRMARGPGFP
jgi:mRNA interferase RelE/StbE